MKTERKRKESLNGLKICLIRMGNPVGKVVNRRLIIFPWNLSENLAQLCGLKRIALLATFSFKTLFLQRKLSSVIAHWLPSPNPI